jgi:hypothetical protein
MFYCWQCDQEYPTQSSGGTGYGRATKHMVEDGDAPHEKATICYACCAVTDRARMLKTGKATLYLTHKPFTAQDVAYYPFVDGKVTNWPESLSFPCRVKRGRHNIARWRYDVWFKVDGQNWHGVSFGDNTQICHCKRCK